MKDMKNSRRKGLTIEYVLVMMALVAAFIALILTTATAGAEKAGAYRQYVERKAVIDEIGRAYVSNKTEGTSIDLNETFGDNEHNLSWTESSTTLIVRRGSNIELYVELERIDGVLTLTVWRYGLI